MSQQPGERQPLLQTHTRSASGPNEGSGSESPQGSFGGRVSAASAAGCTATRAELTMKLQQVGNDDTSAEFQGYFKKVGPEGKQRVVCLHCGQPPLRHTAGSGTNRGRGASVGAAPGAGGSGHNRTGSGLMQSTDSLIMYSNNSAAPTPRVEAGGDGGSVPNSVASGTALGGGGGGGPGAATPPPAAYGLNSAAAWDHLTSGKSYQQQQLMSASTSPRQTTTSRQGTPYQGRPSLEIAAGDFSINAEPMARSSGDGGGGANSGQGRGDSHNRVSGTAAGVEVQEMPPAVSTQAAPATAPGSPQAGRSPTSPGPPVFQPAPPRGRTNSPGGYPGAAHRGATPPLAPRQQQQQQQYPRLPSPTRNPESNPLLIRTNEPTRFVRETTGPRPRGRCCSVFLLITSVLLIYGSGGVFMWYFAAGHPGLRVDKHSCSSPTNNDNDYNNVGEKVHSNNSSTTYYNSEWCSTTSAENMAASLALFGFIGAMCGIFGARWSETGQFIRFAGSFDINTLDTYVKSSPPKIHWSRKRQLTQGAIRQDRGAQREANDPFRAEGGRKELTKIFVEQTKADALFTEAAVGSPLPPHLQPPPPGFPEFEAWEDRSLGFVEASDFKPAGFKVRIRRHLMFADEYTKGSYESEFREYTERTRREEGPRTIRTEQGTTVNVPAAPQWRLEEDFSVDGLTDTTFWGWVEDRPHKVLHPIALLVMGAIGLFPLLAFFAGPNTIGTANLCITKVIYRDGATAPPRHNHHLQHQHQQQQHHHRAGSSGYDSSPHGGPPPNFPAANSNQQGYYYQ